MSLNYQTRTLTIGDATVVIRRPILAASEYRRRESVVKAALENFGRALSSQSVSK